MNILLIDDEPNIARAVGRLLSRTGHTFGWASGIEAAKPQLPGVDFILCDVMMDGETGVDFHRWLVTAHPDLAKRMVFVTGGYPPGDIGAYLRDSGVPVVTKPFDLDVILEMAGGMVGDGPA